MSECTVNDRCGEDSDAVNSVTEQTALPSFGRNYSPTLRWHRLPRISGAIIRSISSAERGRNDGLVSVAAAGGPRNHQDADFFYFFFANRNLLSNFTPICLFCFFFRGDVIYNQAAFLRFKGEKLFV